MTSCLNCWEDIQEGQVLCSSCSSSIPIGSVSRMLPALVNALVARLQAAEERIDELTEDLESRGRQVEHIAHQTDVSIEYIG